MTIATDSAHRVLAALSEAQQNDRDVEIVEVAPRDGLQNDPALLDTDQKIELIKRCVQTGIRRIEVASFVNPKRVPQMADAEAVLAGLPDKDSADQLNAAWIGLVLNARGFERAQRTQVDEINLVVMVTDTFSQKNQGMTTEESIATVESVVPLAKAAGLRTSVTMSASFGCPYEGEVPVGRVADVAGRLALTGVDEIAVADTIGVAVPRDVTRRMAAVTAVVGRTRLRVHVHNTRNTGYASALAAYEAGVRVLDSSLGGIGGCPFAPRATGNIATEDLVFALERSGVNTGLDLDALIRASDWLGDQLGRPTPALVSKAGTFPPH
ncbi:MAG: hydroxymethylglutaryl-CoA lyase [Actinobacteria bacterium]|nr:hydroxymethylglutaryl-CoA lyase [Actinomycetota bacterium]